MSKNKSSSKRARRYQSVITTRAIALGLAITPLMVAAVFMTWSKMSTDSNKDIVHKLHAATPSFAMHTSPEVLAQTFKNTSKTLAFNHLEREQAQEKLALLDAEYSGGFMTRGELDQALIDLVDSYNDSYIALMTSQEYEDMFIRLAGKKVGIQLTFKEAPELDSFVVDSVGQVAASAGIEKGDVFVAIYMGSQIYHVDFLRENGVPNHQIPRILDNVLQSGGRLGSKAKLTLRRGGDIYDFHVERTVIGMEDPYKVSKLDLVKTQIPEGSGEAREIAIKFLDAPDFLTRFRETLEELSNNPSIQGIALNFTECIGGTRESGIQLAAYFLESGVITHEIRPHGNEGVVLDTYFVKDGKVHCTTSGPYSFDAEGKMVMLDNATSVTVDKGWEAGLFKGDLVVAIGANTMGAGELAAAALKGNHRGPVVGGAMTHGKGFAQKFVPVGPDRVVRFSTSVFLQPDGASIESAGIMPTMPLNNPSTWAVTNGMKEAMQRQFRIVPYPTLPAPRN